MAIGDAPPPRSRGFAYLLLLIAIAVIGIASAGAVLMGAQMSRRSAEEHLLAVGADMERALASYRAVGRIGPKQLSDLERDPRTAGLKRHLRRVPCDPITGGCEWGLERDSLGHITAVFSLSDSAPIKRVGFDAGHRHFEAADSYRDWRFGLLDQKPRAQR